jgi:hypothetical protein
MSLDDDLKDTEARLADLQAQHKALTVTDKRPAQDHLMAITDRPREHGHLIITEYNNMGDLSPGAPQEPPILVQKVELGSVSTPLTQNTRLLALWATHGGEFATFHVDDDWEPGDPLPDGIHWVPIAPKYEITRICHMNATIRIAYR